MRAMATLLLAMAVTGCVPQADETDEVDTDADADTDPQSYELRDVAVGERHSCAVTTDWQTVCWGDDSLGQASPPSVYDLGSIQAGIDFTCAGHEGGARCWGSSEYGQTDGTGREASMADVGGHHACAWSRGELSCWGRNDQGQIDVPQVDGKINGEQYQQVVLGANHSCGLLHDGGVECWGDDRDGCVSAVPAEAFVSITAGADHNCGVTTLGTTLCWGSDAEGQSSPPSTGYTQLDAGNQFTCGIDDKGKVDCWGLGTDGQTSPPADHHFSSVDTSINGAHACATYRDDDEAMRVSCWGLNDAGQTDLPRDARARLAKATKHRTALRHHPGRSSDRLDCLHRLGCPLGLPHVS